MTSPSDFGRLGLCYSPLSLWLYWFWKSSDSIAWRHSPQIVLTTPLNSSPTGDHCHCGWSRPSGGPHSDCQTSLNNPIDEHRVDVKSYTSKTWIKTIHGDVFIGAPKMVCLDLSYPLLFFSVTSQLVPVHVLAYALPSRFLRWTHWCRFRKCITMMTCIAVVFACNCLCVH